MEIIVGSIIGGGVFFLGALTNILTNSVRAGRYTKGIEDRIKAVEDKAHSAPCSLITAIDKRTEVMATDIKWLIRNNGGGKNAD